MIIKRQIYARTRLIKQKSYLFTRNRWGFDKIQWTSSAIKVVQGIYIQLRDRALQFFFHTQHVNNCIALALLFYSQRRIPNTFSDPHSTGKKNSRQNRPEENPHPSFQPRTKNPEPNENLASIHRHVCTFRDIIQRASVTAAGGALSFFSSPSRLFARWPSLAAAAAG